MKYSKILARYFYNLSVMLFARPYFQPFFLRIFRANLGYLGYMNWSPDFKLTGEKLALNHLKKFGIHKILDIGANEGQYAKMALDTLSCKVISIEPQSVPFEELNLLKKVYGNRLEIFNLALGDEIKDILINIHKESSELSFIDSKLKKMPLLYGRSVSQEKVEMVTLDSLFQSEVDLLSNIDLIKIDTEGFELNVLKGGLAYIYATHPKFIQIEMNWHHLFVTSTLFQFSELLPNYKVYKILPAGKCLYPLIPTDPVNNVFQLINILFVRKDISTLVMKEKF